MAFEAQAVTHRAFPVLPSREQQIAALGSGKEFDLLVVGGGATGTGIAVDAATRGLNVALVEREDFASGTSSKSTKLIHGGVRYLEKAFWHLDYGQFMLVQEALHERYTFLKIAPHLTNPLPIMIPIYTYRSLHTSTFQAKAIRATLSAKVYDFIASIRGRGLESSYYLPKTKALKEFPMLRTDDLTGAIVYYDGQQNDARMNVSLALTAAEHGAAQTRVQTLSSEELAFNPRPHVRIVVVTNYTEVISLSKDQDGNIKGAQVRDRETGKVMEVRAKGVINATGPFTDSLRLMDDPKVSKIVVPSSGVHVVLPSYYSPLTMGLLDPQTSDGRMIFLLPWEGYTVAGTTDTPVEVTDRPAPLEAEVQWILHELKHYLSTDVNVERGDVLAAWSGIRPLVKDPGAKNTESLVRNHMIHVSPSKLLTVAGGKWTTYRQMAQEAVDTSIGVYGLKPVTLKCQTEDVPIIGAEGYTPSIYVKLIQRFGIEREVAEHLAHSYGDRAFEVAKLAEPTGLRWPVMGRKLHPLHPYLEAEVKYAVRNEYARTATDVLARRTRLAFLNANIAGDSVKKVVELMGTELGWDEARRKREIESTKEYFRTMGISTENDNVRSDFDAMELVKYRRIFSEMDSDKNGVLTEDEISVAFDKVGERISSKELRSIFQSVTKDGESINTIRSWNTKVKMMSKVKKGRSAKDLDKFNDLIKAVDKKIAIERSGGGL